MASSRRESSFRDKDQSNFMLQRLYLQKNSSKFCDVIMKVCGREIYAHSNVLAAASPYFLSFLSQDLPRQFSQRSPQVIEIQIDGSEPNMFYEEAVARVIDFIYTGMIKMQSDNVTQISEIAKIMQIDSVYNFCELFTKQSSDVTITNLPSVVCTSDAGVNTDITRPPPASLLLPPPFSNAPVPDTVELPSISSSHLDDVAMSESDFSSKLAIASALDAHQYSAPLSPTKPLRYKHGRFVSVSCQVTPTLLGIEKSLVRETREEKTQTSARQFITPKEKTIIPGRKRGRPPKIRNVAPITLDEDWHSENVNEITPENYDAATPVPSNAGSDQPITEIKQVMIELIEGPLEDGDEDNDEHAEVAASKPVPTSPGTESVRRSRRTPKPSMKMKDSKHSFIFMDAGLSEAKKRKLSDSSSPSAAADVPEMEAATPDGHLSQSSHVNQTDTADVSDDEDEEYELPEAKYTPNLGYTRRYSYKPRVALQCPDCGYTTYRVRQMANHKKLHCIEKNICHYCNERLKNRNALNDHMEKHKGPLPYFCNLCDSRFKTRAQLKIHLPKHSDEKPFRCDLCSAGFKWKHALKSHMITHTKIKDQLCDICGYATAHKSQLKAHRLIHTGQTYKCTYEGCTFQATKTQNLKYHLLTHTREKPHQCEICGQAFSLVKNLRRHMLLHTAERMKHCGHCDFSTTRFDKLKEHQLKQHGFGTPPEKRVRVGDLVRQNLITVKEEAAEGNNVVVVQEPQQNDSNELIALNSLVAEELPASVGGSMLPGQIITTHSLGAAGLEMIPGQTIIIQQIGDTSDNGTAQFVPLSLAQAQVVDNLDDITYTEVVLPSNQVHDLVQSASWKEHIQEGL